MRISIIEKFTNRSRYKRLLFYLTLFNFFCFYQNETYLYARFLLLSQTYSLIPPSLVSIPDNDSNEDEDEDEEEEEDDDNDYNRNLPHNSSAIQLPRE